MTPLAREHRRLLESTIRKARQIAEAGAKAALEQLAVGHHEPHGTLTPEQRKLRNDLRAHGRQLGDQRDSARGTQAINRLTAECAYEHWHRMLFARFLAETDLLIEPDSGVAISLAECQELARELGSDWLGMAADFAQRMLPQIFRTNDPALQVPLPPETRSALEDLMKTLPREIFLADDSLGWVYQYWQAEQKDAVNKSEKKIGADELPAVTQLFTEDYMVLFLLHNTLGAWWAGKMLAANPELAAAAQDEVQLRAACAIGDVNWTYLRFFREGESPWRPAAGTFDGWPKNAKAITLLDPCMGSGHFLVFALPMLAAMRAEEESLSSEAAIDAVLRDNLFGLEIDPRCTQIAAFNLAFASWRRVGYRQLPVLHLACSGLSLGVSKAEWLKLAERAAQALPAPPKRDLLGTEENLFSDAMKRGFARLYDLFARAPWLGSLIDPRAAGGDLVELGFADLEPLIGQVMAHAAKAADIDLSEMAVAAQGIAKAAQILTGRFTLVTTNVPYLGRGKQDEVLKQYCEDHYPASKADLATCFVERSFEFCAAEGSTALVTPQNWLFLGTYKTLRKQLLDEIEWNTVARLGPHAFETIGGEVVNVALLTLTCRKATKAHSLAGLDASAAPNPSEKNSLLISLPLEQVTQGDQIRNPDARITFDEPSKLPILETLVDAPNGSHGGDSPRHRRAFWEFAAVNQNWRFFQGTVEETTPYGGREFLFSWFENGQAHRNNLNARIQGEHVIEKHGVVVSMMRELPATLYSGELFDISCTPIVPENQEHLPAIWAFCSSPDYFKAVRRIDKKLNVTNATLAKVPFDIELWQKAAAEKYPHGLPKPYSNDPTQWLFCGHPKGASQALHVAVARLAGYRWPRQTGAAFSDCQTLVDDELVTRADREGIVTLSSVKGEQSASDRLTVLLADAFGAEWSAAKLSHLLADAGYADKTLDEWLRDGFFDQHCALFHHRPFVWHIWDGRRDGFHALVNYHRLTAPNGEGRRTLELLLYTYLGDWIERQLAAQKSGVEGADARVAAAEQLKLELMSILAGEPPYDIFVRWKPLVDQAIGWEPDIDDGVRINIRPFTVAKPLGARAKDACILRVTPKIKWDKDRGKEPVRAKEEFPWLWGWDPEDPKLAVDFAGTKLKEPDGVRWNNLHYTRAFKEAARAKAGKTT